MLTANSLKKKKKKMFKYTLEYINGNSGEFKAPGLVTCTSSALCVSEMQILCNSCATLRGFQ